MLLPRKDMKVFYALIIASTIFFSSLPLKALKNVEKIPLIGLFGLSSKAAEANCNNEKRAKNPNNKNYFYFFSWCIFTKNDLPFE